MINLDALFRMYNSFRPGLDDEQRKVVQARPDQPLFIVAGPGSGKTTCLTVRVLKLVLVDGLPPRSILATTFTVKAAQELRSRVLGWGFRIIDMLLTDPEIGEAQKEKLAAIDINQVWTGTLDSLCEQVLRDYRAPGTQPPILADNFVSKTLLARQGLLNERRDQDPQLDAYLLGFYSDQGNRYGYNFGSKVALLQSIWDRRFHDQVDWGSFINKGPATSAAARKLLDSAISDYAAELARRGMVDFALLENEVLQRLRNNQLSDFTEDLKVVLVDEYQDTNLLQEQIYFELASACTGALCVVGDDDQSLYRFRGATVDLFSDFLARYRLRFQRQPKPIYLKVNYRSTKRIVTFVNSYASLDRSYQGVRVSGKPRLVEGPKAPEGQPIFGMFRDTVDELANELADFIHAIFRGKGFSAKGIERLIRNPENGDVGDCALLCSSPEEYSANDQPRLPLLLRQELGTRRPPIQIFNPRGQDFASIWVVEIFGGLLAECIDPGGALQSSTSGLTNEAVATLNRWRQTAVAWAESSQAPAGLLGYAAGWVDRDPKRNGFRWPRTVSAIDLVYGLVHFLPQLHDDPEGQVYLEVFTRQLEACEQVGKFRGRILYDPRNPGLADTSIKELLRDFLGPIASGTVKVDEELIEAFPRDRLNILSIHQSKGLEFPLTIVDVGSDFKTNHPAHRFKRYPIAGAVSHCLEDALRTNSGLKPPTRQASDRAFDDLYRQYFVAYSRAQDVLLLVGLRKTFPGGIVPNAATGWDRIGACRWAGANLPLIEIR